MGHGEGGDQALSLRRVAAELAGFVIWVRRGKSDVGAVKTALKALKGNEKLLIFPEGTRRRRENGDAKTGAAMLAIRTGVPIVPVYITPERSLFPRTKVVIGEPYYPLHGRRATARTMSGSRRIIHEHHPAHPRHPRRTGGPREIGMLAKSAGFCYGVRRAVQLAEKIAGRGRPYVMLGPYPQPGPCDRPSGRAGRGAVWSAGAGPAGSGSSSVPTGRAGPSMRACRNGASAS